MNPRIATLCLLIFALAASRLLPHPPNFTPLAAMALFAGAHFMDRRTALLLPFAALLMSDLILGLHSTMIFVYAAFAITVLMGMWLQKHHSAMSVLAAALASSVVFFLVTNFGSWLSHGMYPHTLEGLLAAYTAGIPFFRNTLLGNLFFTALVFGGFYLAQRRFKVLRVQSPSISVS